MEASSCSHFPEIRALRRNWRSVNRAVSFRATSDAGPSFSESRPQVRLTSKLREEGGGRFEESDGQHGVEKYVACEVNS